MNRPIEIKTERSWAFAKHRRSWIDPGGLVVTQCRSNNNFFDVNLVKLSSFSKHGKTFYKAFRLSSRGLAFDNSQYREATEIPAISQSVITLPVSAARFGDQFSSDSNPNNK